LPNDRLKVQKSSSPNQATGSLAGKRNLPASPQRRENLAVPPQRVPLRIGRQSTAIYSRSGGSMGIGFAIPTSTARSVLDSIVKDGQVTRGWIGVEPQDLSPELAESFGIQLGAGVIITGVLQDGPAAQAGLKPGDVITRVAERDVKNVAELLSAVAALPPGTPADLEIMRRDGKSVLQVTPGRRNLPPRQLPR
jgi:S1-C subfamily serine protease